MAEKSTLDEIRGRGILRFAVSFTPPPETGHAPEFYLDPESGEARGVLPELGKVMASDLRVELSLVDLPWPEHMQALLDGRVDLLLSYTNTPQRALEIEFADRMLPSEVLLMVLANGGVQSRADLVEARIGIWHGSSIARVAVDRFPQATIMEFPDPPVALRAGRVDACAVDAVTRIYMARNPDLQLLRNKDGRLVVLAREYGHPAVRPGDQRFLNWINSWLDYHRAQGTIGYWCGSYWQSWMAQ